MEFRSFQFSELTTVNLLQSRENDDDEEEEDDDDDDDDYDHDEAKSDPDFYHTTWLFETKETYGYGNGGWPKDGYGAGFENWKDSKFYGEKEKIAKRGEMYSLLFDPA
ncbi:unnamed protein product [Dovyalis caffra]|uniref:Uncharacterized protein n=1 Tax=Dovyalis caffra TaxID=77055 RepID=A0AAV1SFU4_9ROSI|nr:unnamed protein product [Dovyalis caffra]